MSTYLHKVKCTDCQLHFIACSWNEDWQPGFCPECGRTDAFIRWATQETDAHIFQLVPGSAEFDLTSGLGALR